MPPSKVVLFAEEILSDGGRRGVPHMGVRVHVDAIYLDDHVFAVYCVKEVDGSADPAERVRAKQSDPGGAGGSLLGTTMRGFSLPRVRAK